MGAGACLRGLKPQHNDAYLLHKQLAKLPGVATHYNQPWWIVALKT